MRRFNKTPPWTLRKHQCHKWQKLRNCSKLKNSKEIWHLNVDLCYFIASQLKEETATENIFGETNRKNVSMYPHNKEQNCINAKSSEFDNFKVCVCIYFLRYLRRVIMSVKLQRASNNISDNNNYILNTKHAKMFIGKYRWGVPWCSIYNSCDFSINLRLVQTKLLKIREITQDIQFKYKNSRKSKGI